jgi:GntR family transcriptional regulator
MEMLLKGLLKRNIPIPLYYQLKEIVLNEILNGKLEAGDCLPTENEFMSSYQISRATVRQAMTELVNENYLTRQKGKGTFVSKPKITQQYINRVETYKEQMNKIGMNPTTEVIIFQITKANLAIGKELGLAKGAKIIELVRLRLIDAEPIVVAKTYMPYEICAFVLEHNMQEESLYQILAEHSETRITKVKRTIEAVVAGESIAKRLKIMRGDAIQIIRTSAVNSKEQVIEYTIAKYRGDRNLFVVETQVDR